MSTPANALVQSIRSKYPGQYDDLSDGELTSKILAKYPQYSDLAGQKVSNPAKEVQQSTENPITAPLSKATGISAGPSTIMQRLAAGRVPGLDELQSGMESVGNGKGLPTQPTLMGKIGQFGGILAKNPASQALFGAMVPTPEPIANTAKEWQAINETIGATKSAVRIPKSAGTIEDALTMPARGLQKEGFNAGTLSKMNPIEQQAAVAPKWNAAGKAIDNAAIDATAKNIVVNPSKSALEVTSSIQNPVLRDRAVKQLSDLMQEIGISDASKATPLETLQLRRALQSGARFGPNGDLSSLGGIRAKLYSAVSGDLSEAVPGFSQLDQHYSDLNSAIKAINNSASKASVKSSPSLISQIAPIAAREAGKAAGYTAGGGSLYAIYRLLKK